MIQRPPACERHAAELPGKANIVPPEKCPWCWQEENEKVAYHHPKGFAEHLVDRNESTSPAFCNTCLQLAPLP